MARKIAERRLAEGQVLLFGEEQRSYDKAYATFTAACIRAGHHDDGARHLTRLDAEKARWEREHKGETMPEEEQASERASPDLAATFTPHGLRHSYGVAAARAGLHVAAIKKYMGHCSVRVTERYMKWAPGAERSGHASARGTRARSARPSSAA